MDHHPYGLNEAPFALTPDARFYFASAGQRKAMAYLGYGLTQGEGFIVVTGEVGAGKSTLVAHVLATVDPARVTVGAIGSTALAPGDMLKLAAQAFGVPVGGLSASEVDEALRTFIALQVRSGRKVLLIVDEAQALTTGALEELRRVTNYVDDGRALAQVMLLGQPEFRDRLDGEPGLEQLRQRVIASYHLDAMTADEVEAYLRHRFVCAGWSGRPALSADAFEALARASGGIPRRLNLIASRLLIHGELTQRDDLDQSDVEAVLEERREAVASTMPQASEPAAGEEEIVDEAASETDDVALEWIRRVEALEAQVREQDAAIRRMLTLMVNWAEAPRPEQQPGQRAA